MSDSDEGAAVAALLCTFGTIFALLYAIAQMPR